MGGIPTQYMYYSFKDILIRPFSVQDLSLVFKGVQHKRIAHIIRAMDASVDIDINELTDGDFLFCQAHARGISYPSSNITATWNCHRPVVRYKDKIVRKPFALELNEAELAERGWKREECGFANAIIVNQATIRPVLPPDNFQMPEGLAFPRVSTLIELEEALDEDEIALPYRYCIRALRWIKEGKTIADKWEYINSIHGGMELLDLAFLCEDEIIHGAEETIPIRCDRCDFTRTVKRLVDPYTFLACTTETSVLDMQYNLMGAMGISIDEDAPARKLLYWHSSYVKDKTEQDSMKQQFANTAVGGKVG